MVRQFYVMSGPDRGLKFELSEGEQLVIGFGAGNALELKDPLVSNPHCQILMRGGHVVVIDVGSAGGTYVNDEVVDKRLLRPQELVRIGQSHFGYGFERVPQEPIDSSTTRPVQSEGTARFKIPKRLSVLERLVGTELDGYAISDVIGVGRTGLVFDAKDVRKNRRAALKVLHPAMMQDSVERERFARAMRTVIHIRHENIVRLYGAGKTQDYCWYAMEYIDGPSIVEIVKLVGTEGALDWKDVYQVALHVAGALEFTLAQGIIHRNICPQNLIRRRGDHNVMLSDLVYARALRGALSRRVTLPGQVVGTIDYVAPERIYDAKNVDHRSDLYGLGATLYALLTGYPPFVGERLEERNQKLRPDAPQLPSTCNPNIEGDFERIVMRLLERKPKARYQNPTELLRDLERISRKMSEKSRSDGWG